MSVAADAARASFATNLSFLAAAPLGFGRWRDRCGDGLRPTLGVMHVQDAGDNGFDGFALLGVELGDGLELKLEALVRPALILLKKQRICADAERERNAQKHFDGGLGSVNRFSTDGNGVYHWSGSTGDASTPLDVSKVPIDVKRLLGFKGR